MAEAPHHRVVLWSRTRPDLTSYLWAGFDDAGNLQVDGQDMGEPVERFFGRDEYEYYLTVKKADVFRLAAALAQALGETAPSGEAVAPYITAKLKQIYAEPPVGALHFTNSTDLREFLKKHSIPEEFTTW